MKKTKLLLLISVFLHTLSIKAMLPSIDSLRSTGAGNGGQSVYVGDNAYLRDIQERNNCIWRSGKGINDKFPLIKKIIKKVEKVHWLFALRIEEEINKLFFCLTTKKLPPLSYNNSDDLYIFTNTPFDQPAINDSDIIFLDMNIINDMPPLHQAFIIIHEALHEFFSPDEDRIKKGPRLRELVMSIHNHYENEIDPDSFHISLKQAKMPYLLIDLSKINRKDYEAFLNPQLSYEEALRLYNQLERKKFHSPNYLLQVEKITKRTKELFDEIFHSNDSWNILLDLSKMGLLTTEDVRNHLIKTFIKINYEYYGVDKVNFMKMLDNVKINKKKFFNKILNPHGPFGYYVNEMSVKNLAYLIPKSSHAIYFQDLLCVNVSSREYYIQTYIDYINTDDIVCKGGSFLQSIMNFEFSYVNEWIRTFKIEKKLPHDFHLFLMNTFNIVANQKGKKFISFEFNFKIYVSSIKEFMKNLGDEKAEIAFFQLKEQIERAYLLDLTRGSRARKRAAKVFLA